MSFVGSNILAGASGQGGGGFAIERSLRFNSGDSAYLNRTFSAGNRKTWTWSSWIKLSSLSGRRFLFSNRTSALNGHANLYFEFDSSHKLRIGEWNSSWSWKLETNALFRDPSAWYHIVASIDTTQSTASNRAKIYINGVEQTLSTSDYPSQNSDTYINQAAEHVINLSNDNSSFGDFYYADVHFIDGQALAATDFGETDEFGVWQPKEFAGSYTAAASGTTTSLSQVGWASSDQANIWDGNTSTRAVGYVNNSVGTISFNPPLTNVTKVETYTQSYNHFLNGSSVSPSGSGNPGWYTLYDNSSSPITLNSLGNSYDSNQTVDFYAIRINDTIVNAQTWTPPSGVGLGDSGANSFHLDFADNSSNATLGYDAAGSNNWTVNNLTASVGAPTDAIAFDGDDKLTFSGPGSITGDCTIECFIKAASYAGSHKRIISADEASQAPQFTLIRSYNNRLYFIFGSSGDSVTNNFVAPSTNEWHHIAMTRSGTTVSYFMDGTRLGTSSHTGGTINITSTVLAWGYGSEYFTGEISNARIVDGQALYTGSTYTVPTADLTTTSQGATSSYVTHLLANTSTVTANGGTGSAGTAGGNPAAVTASPFGDPANIDSLVDTPTNGTQTDTGAGGEVVGNYATLSPLAIIQNVSGDTSTPTFSNGNLTYDGVSSKWGPGFGSIAIPSTGKWYFEATISSSGSAIVGIAKYLYATGNRFWDQGAGTQTLYKNAAGSIGYSGTSQASGTALSAGDIVGVGINCDDDEAKFYRNGALEATVTIPAAVVTAINNGEAFPFVDTYNGIDWNLNFGQRAFANSNVPSGYKALCTSNLPDPTIADGSLYFDTKLYTGNGLTNTAITGLNFNPDLVWIKARSAAYDHMLNDSVRGATKSLRSNLTDAEGTNANDLQSFDTNGFTVGYGGYVNGSGQTFASWNWDAGSSNTTIAAGSLNSSAYDQSQTWSSSVTSDNGFAGNSYGATQAFNGTTSGNHTASNSNGTLTFAPNLTIPANSVIEIYAGSGSTAYMDVTVNGVANNSTAGGAFVQINYDNSTTLTSLTITRTGGGNSADLRGLKINGKLLVDSGVSVPNVPSIASTVRANPSAGFSIVTYSAASNPTIGHGLNAVPEFVIVKVLNVSSHWTIFHKDLGVNKELRFTTAAASTVSGIWGTDSMWTSSTFGVYQTINQLDNNYGNMVAYCFAPIEGYSAMGSYEGNGSADGPFIYTGFKVAWLMTKNIDNYGSGYDWHIYDNERNLSNVCKQRLNANLSNAEDTYDAVDFVSNGFKLRNLGGSINQNAHTHVYLAFAENPFKTARAR